MLINSVSYDNNQVTLQWADKAYIKDDQVLLGEHDYKLYTSKTNLIMLDTEYDVLILEITFERKLANKLAGVYFPTGDETSRMIAS